MVSGYRYDTETGLYYLQSRYYNPEWGRFINADALAGQVGELLSDNIFAYCKNNSISFSDKCGFRPIYSMGQETDAMRATSLTEMSKAANSTIMKAAKKASNSLPRKGVPNSKVRTPDGKQEREYDENGRAKRDTDYGHPEHHPDLESPHYHDWEWNGDKCKRGDAYNIGTIVIGVGITAIGIVGLAVVTADNVTGIGVADDPLAVPLSGVVGKGLIMIFGG